MKGIKPTNAEHRERVQMCRRLLGRCFHDGEIKSVMAKRYGISTRTVERYLRRARELMVEETGQPRHVLQAESVEFYRRVASSEKEKTRDRISARERMDKVLGLEAPTRLAGADGGPLTLAAILSTVDRTEPAPAERTGNVIDIDAEMAAIRSEQLNGNGSA